MFNEDDVWIAFNRTGALYSVADVVAMARSADPTRLIDADSGGHANAMGLGDVNDVHRYPAPVAPPQNWRQYGMVGEFGGVGAFTRGREWVPGGCFAYLYSRSSADMAAAYIAMTQTLLASLGNVSAAVYTQTSDVETECDGFLNYDRTHKLTPQDTARIAAANRALTSPIL